jgi:hypothetical protein
MTNHPNSVKPRWWETPGSLRTSLLLLDGQVGTGVNAERHLVAPVVVSGEVARQLERIAQQTGLEMGCGGVEPVAEAPGFEPLKSGFSRETGSLRHRLPPRGVRDAER